MKFFTLSICLILSQLNLLAQTEDLQEGTLIAAKQAYFEGKIKQAMILTGYVLELNSDNLEAQDFAETIKKKKEIR